jgi:hypothetical protein
MLGGLTWVANVNATWPNLGGQCLNVTWPSLDAHCLNVTWHLTNQLGFDQPP